MNLTLSALVFVVMLAAPLCANSTEGGPSESMSLEQERHVMPFALVPGWVQFREGQTAKGAVVAGGFAGCALLAAYFNAAGETGYSAWKSAPTDSLKAAIQQDDTLYAVAAYAAIGMYAFNLLDVFVLDHSADEAPSDKSLSPYRPQIGLALLPHQTTAITLEWSL